MKKFLPFILSILPFVCIDAETITLDIPSAEEFGLWTTIDANKDGDPYLWAYNDQDALYTENKKGAADDWIISPAITLKGGATYSVTAFVRNATTYTSDKQKFTINAGTAPEVAALTSVLYKNESLAKGSFYSSYGGNFTPEADGEYYFAIHCYSASYNGNFMFQKFVVEEQISHPGAVTDLNAAAAPEGELKAELSWTWPTVSDLGGTFTGAVSANIYRNSSANFPSDLSSCLIGTVADDQQGEAATYTDDTLTEPGIYYYRVVTFNEDGDSKLAANATSAWIGKDTSVKQATNVVATVVDDHTVSLTFTPATEGTNGGYVDLADIAYRISRKAGNDNPEILEEAYTGELPYIDSNINGLNSYVYTVTTIYQGTAHWSSSSSAAVVLGGAVAVPYSQDFSSSNHFFSFFHGAGASRDWSVNSQRLQYWGNPADAYAVSPAIELEAGKAYELSFSTRLSSSTSASWKDLYVLLGREASAEGLDTQIFFENIQSSYSATKTVKFSVPESGNYYLAFRCFGSVNSNDIYVDDIKINEILIAPNPVTDLVAAAAEKGEMSVTLTWLNPSQDNTGAALANVDKIIIARDGAEIATLENRTPGEADSYTDTEIADPGKYTYSATVFLGSNPADAVSATSGWVGLDTPQAVPSVSATYDEETNTVAVTWEAVPELGQNGGYVDTEAIRYNVLRQPNAEVISDQTATLAAEDRVGDLALGRYFYEVSIDGYDDVASTASEPITLGDAIDLPYEPDYSDAATFDIWTTIPGQGGTSIWKYNNSSSTYEASFTSKNPWAFTPPFKAVVGEYKLVYRATCYNARYTEDIEVVLAETPSDNIEDMTVIDSRKIETVSWPSDIEVEFSIAKEGKYYIGFHCATSDSWKLALHKSNIYLMLNTGVENVTAETGLAYDPASATVGAPSDIEISVFKNDGTLVAKGRKTVDLSSLSRGIYIARAGEAAIKFVR